MSAYPDQEPTVTTAPCAEVEAAIMPRMRDLGGFEVRRVLPSAERRMVGPFVFLDQMGPTVFKAGTGIDVRPHPHIGLATITYLFAGEILHRDSLGNVQAIRPGEVNWMTAGRGIVHSERTPPAVRAAAAAVSGIQAWVGLPRAHEETDPSFIHHGTAGLPVIDGEGKRVRLMIGRLYGERSPVATFAETIYADAALDAGARLSVPREHEERAVHVIEGRIEVAGRSFGAGQLIVLRAGKEVTVATPEGARLLLLGGAPMDGPRHLWWNFVSSSKERIEGAKADWKHGRFPPVPGETEFTPLPE